MFRRPGALSVGLVAAAAVLPLAGCGSGLAPAADSTPSSVAAAIGSSPPRSAVFVAVVNVGAGDIGGGSPDTIAELDQVTGRRVRDLVVVDPGSGLPVGLSGQADGSIVYGVAHQGTFRPGHGGRGPDPGTCGGAVYRLDRRGTRAVLFTIPADARLDSPVVNQAGTAVAYETADCSKPNADVRTSPGRIAVQDLAGGAPRYLSLDHAVPGRPAWSADGRTLAFAVYPIASTRIGEAGRYAVVDIAATGTVADRWMHTVPDAGCSAGAMGFDATGLVVIETCIRGGPEGTRLLQFDSAGTTLKWSTDLHACGNGETVEAELSTRPAVDDLLVTVHAACGAVGNTDVVQLWHARQPRKIASYDNPGMFVRYAIW